MKEEGNGLFGKGVTAHANCYLFGDPRLVWRYDSGRKLRLPHICGQPNTASE